MKKKLITAFKFIFFIGIGIFFIWWFLRKLSPIEKSEIIKSFHNANYLWVLLTIIPGIASHMSRALRWRMLLKPMGYEPTIRNTFFSIMIGYLANLAFPRLGEVMRCGILQKYEKIPVNKSFGTVITERTIDMIVFTILFFFTLFLFYNELKDYIYDSFFIKFSDKINNINITGAIFISIGAIILLCIVLFFIFKKQIVSSNIYIKSVVFLMGFVEGLKSLSKISNIYLFIFHTLFIWANYFLMTWLIFWCFEQTSTLGMDVALAALVMGSVGIMIVPGGIGIYPVIISQTLLLFSITKTTGYALGWIAWSSQTFLIIIFGLGSLIALTFIKKKKHVTI